MNWKAKKHYGVAVKIRILNASKELESYITLWDRSKNANIECQQRIGKLKNSSQSASQSASHFLTSSERALRCRTGGACMKGTQYLHFTLFDLTCCAIAWSACPGLLIYNFFQIMLKPLVPTVYKRIHSLTAQAIESGLWGEPQAPLPIPPPSNFPTAHMPPTPRAAWQ